MRRIFAPALVSALVAGACFGAATARADLLADDPCSLDARCPEGKECTIGVEACEKAAKRRRLELVCVDHAPWAKRQVFCPKRRGRGNADCAVDPEVDAGAPLLGLGLLLLAGAASRRRRDPRAPGR